MIDQLSLFDPPSQAHSPTSKAAAIAIKPARQTLQARVLDLIRAAGYAGLTDEQIITILNMNPSTERPRRIELQEAGKIVDSGRTRKTRSGRNAVVWVISG